MAANVGKPLVNAPEMYIHPHPGSSVFDLRLIISANAEEKIYISISNYLLNLNSLPRLL